MSTRVTLPPVESWRRRLFLPAYTIADGARYARTNPQTIYYWYFGGGGLGPALPGKEHQKPLSYYQLVEIAFVATFRQLGVSLQRIRKARQYLASTLNSEFPFAEHRLLTEGHHILMELQEVEPDHEIGRLIVADVGGQTAWQPMVGERFAQFDYEHGLALKWYPAGRQLSVVIDPRVAFGAPTMRGIPTWVLKGRWNAGESIEEMQEDFDLERHEITNALTFEGIEVAA